MLYYLTIGLTVASNVLYHLFLKLTPDSVNPILSLTITYAVAMLATILLYPFFPNHSPLLDNLRGLNWTSYALGIAIVGLEVGFILAYRLGWQISLAAVISNISVAILLIPLGLLLFQESLTGYNLLGLLFCLIGLVLVNYKA